MIKLIVSDIDGTLIPYGESVLPEALFPLIRRLGRAGIRFCPASGRQYHSLRLLFAPVADEICVLCENGGLVFGAGTEETAPVLSKTPMPREDVLELARAIMETDGCDVLLSGERYGYVCNGSPALLHDLQYRAKSQIREVARVEDIAEDIVKVSAYCPNVQEAALRALGPRFGQPYHMAVAGPDWVDFMLADKGSGLAGLCRALGIGLSETAAFGDNWNDVPMLDLAGEAYLMSTASEELRARYPRQCGSVMEVLERMLSGRQGDAAGDVMLRDC